ncbi:MAG: hypothetical protein ACRDSE_13420, partial [Pseudonocardiaceae bacterium]
EGAFQRIRARGMDIPADGACGGGAILLDVEILFTTMLVLAIVAVTWFSVYVVYRIYSDQR